MNIIRTKVVELEIIPAVVYKIKLKSGGSGIKMHRTDQDATYFAEISTRTGDVIISGNHDPNLFPDEAFNEAIDLLAGLPYSARGKVKIMVSDDVDAEEVCTDEVEGQALPTAACMLESPEFIALVDRFSDENGKINYALMNKQFMQFASTSKVVSEMIGRRESEGDIRMFIIKNRAAHLANKREHLSDDEANALLEALNEINPRSAFKELNLFLRRRLGGR
ncbi:MAG: hypothetical protein FWE11_07445 [Defluviitaleaceae bacterium]|nr:hypothetical protein [Defluviitaleaceae bacterium]